MRGKSRQGKGAACANCGKGGLSRNEIGASRKMLGDDGKRYCYDCLCELTGYDREELEDMIAGFKAAGCQYF